MEEVLLDVILDESIDIAQITAWLVSKNQNLVIPDEISIALQKKTRQEDSMASLFPVRLREATLKLIR